MLKLIDGGDEQEVKLYKEMQTSVVASKVCVCVFFSQPQRQVRLETQQTNPRMRVL